MAKILYGVAGEGLGHAVRSKVVIGHLRKNNIIKIVAAAKAYDYLSKFFDVEEIDYFRIIYRNNKAANFLTFFNNFFRFPCILAKSWKISRIIRNFKPDVVITDFEPLSDYFAFFKNIPAISIDNQHIITKGRHKDMPISYWFYMLITKIIVKCFIIKSKKRFINTFYDIKLKDENSILITPLLRQEIFKLKNKDKGHILVYQTSKSNIKLIEVLNKINCKFIVYGFNENKKIKNVTLKDADEKEFFKDLSACKAVIANGGFTLISEALYLKKPILSIPVKKQFEQILNAIYLERLGYGMYSKETNKENILRFTKNIQKYKKNLNKYNRYDNRESLKKIDDTIKSLS